MGQDDSCGVCGKHYMICKDARKEHIPGQLAEAICGQSGVITLPDDWQDMDIDPDALCKRCVRIHAQQAAAEEKE